MRKTLFFLLITALASLGIASLVKSMQVQNARVQLMQNLSTQLGVINPAESKKPCEINWLTQSWQQLQKSSAAIDLEFAFVLQDSTAKTALTTLQATLRKAPNCGDLPRQFRALEKSCDQCHRAVRGGAQAAQKR